MSCSVCFVLLYQFLSFALVQAAVTQEKLAAGIMAAVMAHRPDGSNGCPTEVKT